MENNSNYFFEAEQISNYLLSVSIRESEKNKYADAMQKLNIQFSEYEQILWTSMLKSKWRMACIDSGLALKDPNNLVRRKVFTMLAILEASPHYTSYFLSRNFSIFYIFKLGLVGVRAVSRAIVGIFMVKKIKQQCS